MSSWSSKRVIIVDSARALSTSEIYSLFANYGEILNILPFILPPKSLRDFPGLSQYFVEFSEASNANQASMAYVPADLKVDLLADKVELVRIFISEFKKAAAAKHSLEANSQQISRSLRNRDNKLMDCVAIIYCPAECDESQLRAVFSTCGDIIHIYEWLYKKSRGQTRQYFIDFAQKRGVDRAQTEHFPGFNVISLAVNTRFLKIYMKLTKAARTPVPKDS